MTTMLPSMAEPLRSPAPAADASALKGRRGLSRLWHAAGHSARGLKDAWRGEAAFRQEVVLAAIALPLACWLGRGWVEIALLAGSVWAVLVVELLNSAIEAAIDRIGPQLHDLSRRAKDIGSAAVLLSLVGCAAVWLAAAWQRFFA